MDGVKSKVDVKLIVYDVLKMTITTTNRRLGTIDTRLTTIDSKSLHLEEMLQ